MFGLGGTLTEVIKDVVFRMAPLTPKDAREMIEAIRGKKILESFRGESPVDMNGLMQILIALGKHRDRVTKKFFKSISIP